MGRSTSNGPYGQILDFPGYAQEFLRRNPDYRKQYEATEESIARGSPTSMREVMALQWGLSFPFPAGQECG